MRKEPSAPESAREAIYLLKPVEDLTNNPRNARTHSDAQIAKIAKSIGRFKFLNPIIIDSKGVVIAGHGRLAAAKTLGLTEVPCLLADHLTDAEARAYMLADNRMALDAGWDSKMLKIELTELSDIGFDLGFTGFDTPEIDKFTRPVGGGEDEEVPAPPVNPVSVLGDTWVLGTHRVRCGSSTDAADVSALLGDAKPHLMVTDPPYGVEYDAKWRTKVLDEKGKRATVRATGKVMNDDQADWHEAWELFPGDVAYVWHADRFSPVVGRSLETCGFALRNLIIWNKSSLAIGRGDYHHKHEPAWYAVRKTGTGHWNGSRKETTVWDIDKPQKSETGHSTQKPVECMRRPILNNSKLGDAVYDPFLGSGTTVIAAETEGRSCYGMELSPAYVDVIVRRWESFTGKKAVLEGTNKSFDKITAERQAVAA